MKFPIKILIIQPILDMEYWKCLKYLLLLVYLKLCLLRSIKKKREKEENFLNFIGKKKLSLCAWLKKLLILRK